MRRIEESMLDVDGVSTFVRRVDGDGVPAVFVHGHPTHSQDWVPFLERIEGPAVALDLPGWGRSERPAGFDYSFDGLAAFLGRLLDELGIVEHRLVVHDWGALALIAAQAQPDRVRRLWSSTRSRCSRVFAGTGWHGYGAVGGWAS